MSDNDTRPQDRPYNVLFLCTGNSARSIMAECVLDRVGQGRFVAYSAGSHPAGEVHPDALDLLRRRSHAVAALRSKDWAEFARPEAPELDLVITVCDNAAGEICPVWPGQPATAHWGLPDPAAAGGNEAHRRRAFADVYQELTTRLKLLVDLPPMRLDRMALQRHARSIGNPLD